MSIFGSAMGSNPIDMLGADLSMNAETVNSRLCFSHALLGIGSDVPVHAEVIVDCAISARAGFASPSQ
ncbi:MAG: hypothetical protein PHT58_01935 [Eubacteriales bacterium]|nr:hypothetical protein [Eubacteriales bacterium]